MDTCVKQMEAQVGEVELPLLTWALCLWSVSDCTALAHFIISKHSVYWGTLHCCAVRVMMLVTALTSKYCHIINYCVYMH